MLKLIGKHIILRLVGLEDADFIVSLRMNDKKNKYLSRADLNTQKQIAWLKQYKQREKEALEYYFIIESKDRERLGLVRLYDFKADSFCWGSFIIKDGAPFYAAIETALCVYDFAFYELGFKKSHFDVRKDNEKVVAFHKRFGAKIVAKNEVDYFFNFSLEEYEQSKKRYEKFTLNNATNNKSS